MNIKSLTKINPIPTLISAGIIVTAAGAVVTAIKSPVSDIKNVVPTKSMTLDSDTAQFTGK